ncbi:MAG TPA: hypothetical protein PKW50_01405, partial [Syntrophomonas sp.]|nr:hypothetical protein [Syntrophomonas sp.]
MHRFSSLKIKARLMVAFFIVAIVAGVAGYIAASTGVIWAASALIAGILLTIYGASVSANQTNNLINNIIAATKNIAQGNVDFEFNAGVSYEARMLNDSFTGMMNAIKAMVKDVEMLNNAMTEGKLDIRADASQHNGEYGVIVAGLNASLDAVIGPLNVAAEYVERISKGDIPAKINDSYNGDFNEIKNNLNHCIDGLGGLVESSDVLKKLSTNNYTTQVKGHYQGIFKETADNVNLIRAILLLIVEGNEKIASGDFEDVYQQNITWGKRCEEDRLVPSYIMLMENIKRLVEDANILAEGAIEGKLDIRADVTQHQGQYRKVIEGINNTLDAVIGPLNVAAEYIERIANGNTPPKITDDYNGDFNEIKNNLNTCIDAISSMVDEVGVAIAAGVEGRLDQRANVESCKGVYHKILAGVNATMDALIAPVNEAILVVDELAQGRLNIKMTGDYQGDNAKLKDSLNLTLATLSDVIGEVSESLGQISNGNLAINIDKEYPGDFSNISSAIKHIIESLNEIMGDINHAAEQVASGA